MVECPNLIDGKKCSIGGYKVIEPRVTCIHCDWRKLWVAADRCKHLLGKVEFWDRPGGNLELNDQVLPATYSFECKKGKTADSIYCRDTCDDRD